MAANNPAPLSPEWWLDRQWKRIQARLPIVKEFDSYYRGRPTRTPWVPEQVREDFYRLLDLTRSNIMGLIADTLAERVQALGFRIGDKPDADKDIARIWEANGLELGSDLAVLEAIISGSSYLMVDPFGDEPKTPKVHVEHPSQATVEYVPGTACRDRAAGLKVFVDDWTGNLCATMFLAPDKPGGKALVFKWEADAKSSASGRRPQWKRREIPGEDWPGINPLGVVPIVELANNPRLLPDPVTGMRGVSELDDLLCIQDRIGKTIADRLMTQDYGAFPQKWATGYPEHDEAGNENRIDIGRNRLVQSDAQETKFGQWDSAPLDPYSAAKREDVKDAASRSRTPAQYLLGELNNVNGETLRAAESGLVSKARQRMRGYDGTGLKPAVVLIRMAAGLRPAKSIETIWRNPEFRTEGELVDALVKMAGLGLPRQVIWEKWGGTPAEIERWLKLAEAEAARSPELQVAAALGGTAPAKPAGEPGADGD